ncbi:MAG: hypothetical protein KJZ62_11690 [Fimbriimonadaceae bacterium]|nr:hypothetical protein [Fimbriimonadaceae bacterium]MCL4285748.1 hypothetical protein [Fimbriimonadaceae bacterium]QOJ10630.1 MAG: hypothetical protein HRU74_00640 [Chthonomonadaceae bacterium]
MNLLSLLLVGIVQSGQVCPIDFAPPGGSLVAADFGGVRLKFCGQPCLSEFKKQPVKSWQAALKSGKIVGTLLFDPVIGKKLTPETTRGGVIEYSGVRYGFSNAQNKATFQSSPALYAPIPLKQALYCPVMGLTLAHYWGTSGFADVDGVRIYACCENCYPKLRSDAVALAPKAKEYVGEPKVFEVAPALLKLTGPGG